MYESYYFAKLFITLRITLRRIFCLVFYMLVCESNSVELQINLFIIIIIIITRFLRDSTIFSIPPLCSHISRVSCSSLLPNRFPFRPLKPRLTVKLLSDIIHGLIMLPIPITSVYLPLVIRLNISTVVVNMSSALPSHFSLPCVSSMNVYSPPSNDVESTS